MWHIPFSSRIDGDCHTAMIRRPFLAVSNFRSYLQTVPCDTLRARIAVGKTTVRRFGDTKQGWPDTSPTRWRYRRPCRTFRRTTSDLVSFPSILAIIRVRVCRSTKSTKTLLASFAPPAIQVNLEDLQEIDLPSSFGVIDLFAGPGGLGEGFAALVEEDHAPFRIGISVENEASAHRTLTLRAFLREHQRREGGLPSEFIKFHAGCTSEPIWAEVDGKAWQTATQEARCGPILPRGRRFPAPCYRESQFDPQTQVQDLRSAASQHRSLGQSDQDPSVGRRSKLPCGGWRQ